MAGSVNKVILVGNVGAEPEIRSMQDGKEIAHLSIATSDSWRDKQTGEKRERTEWHRVVIFSPGLVTVVKNYVHKGSKLFIEGALQTRKWTDQSGQDKYMTEVVLQGYGGTLTMLDSRRDGAGAGGFSDSTQSAGYSAAPAPAKEAAPAPELDDEIPF